MQNHTQSSVSNYHRRAARCSVERRADDLAAADAVLGRARLRQAAGTRQYAVDGEALAAAPARELRAAEIAREEACPQRNDSRCPPLPLV